MSQQSYETPSKSQRKREAQAKFKLGRELAALKPELLSRLAQQTSVLDPQILEAIQEARKCKSHVAHKRQLQYLAKLLRNVDTRPIEALVSGVKHQSMEQTIRHHRIEAWRDHLIASGDAALALLCRQDHRVDPQLIRQLLRKAAKETQGGHAPAAARQLFRLLMSLDQEQALPSPDMVRHLP